MGDYVAEFSSDMNTLYVDLFGFNEGIDTVRDDSGVPSRLVSISMTMDQSFGANDIIRNSRSSDLILPVRGTVRFIPDIA